ncbi:hypothetical protein PUNSTDRAFT_132213 [Punctularia strigosozonata HHB-11173 SS5]|uniref:uncharacterized protein n=1 Tax=Punctularia strigosozonata (strain HHB-11173) TaxID=741275 RepID=UPI00044163FA|nr:uncharacterized protein PUNSTDRAFT_132213 [Punctularia strigosozonata HHB-11173 SS5]EIN12082.1 hypothetical protein PUNSTDRAFT_132213 [Punctularia strigosozonata HHB-11173 SS5]
MLQVSSMSTTKSHRARGGQDACLLPELRLFTPTIFPSAFTPNADANFSLAFLLHALSLAIGDVGGDVGGDDAWRAGQRSSGAPPVYPLAELGDMDSIVPNPLSVNHTIIVKERPGYRPCSTESLFSRVMVQ